MKFNVGSRDPQLPLLVEEHDDDDADEQDERGQDGESGQRSEIDQTVLAKNRQFWKFMAG